MKRIYITTKHGYTELAQYLAIMGVSETVSRTVKNDFAIATPYSYSNEINLFRDNLNRLIYWAETKHKNFDVYQIIP